MISSGKPSLSAVILYLASTLFFLALVAPPAYADTIRLNCTDRYWYPFVFPEQDRAHGIFIDIVGQALENLGIGKEIVAVPYKRAINNCLKGKADGIIGIGFSSELANRLEFPPDTDTEKRWKWQIARVEHVVVSAMADDYRFTGDTLSLPPPIRLRQGSLLLQELQEAGVTIHELRDDIQGIRQLSRDGTGVVITTSIHAEKIVNAPEFRGQIRIHGTPLASNPYYLAFAKGCQLTGEQKSRIWKEIRRLRRDYIFILQVYSRY